jgi:NADH:ubiquinone oxidoreductase subunit E
MMKIHVCIGSACHLKGSYNIINTFQQLVEEYHLSDTVEVNAAFCFGCCVEAVSVKIDEGEVHSVTGASAREFFVKNVLPCASTKGVLA